MGTSNAQLGLALGKVKCRWGGRREGAGRKPTGKAKGLPHRARPWHDKNHPVHVTLRVRRGMGSLRRYGMAAEILETFRRAATTERQETFRVIELSVQPDHLHLIVEAGSKASLGRGMQGLVSRLARRINARCGTKGRVFGDRYHGRALATPTEVRNAIVYVLTNAAKHQEEWTDRGTETVEGLDPCSSACWSRAWKRSPPRQREAAPVAEARTWLLTVGWRRLGLVERSERPRT